MFLTLEKKSPIVIRKSSCRRKCLMCQRCNWISREVEHEENATFSLNWVLVILGAAFAHEKNLQLGKILRMKLIRKMYWQYIQAIFRSLLPTECTQCNFLYNYSIMPGKLTHLHLLELFPCALTLYRKVFSFSIAVLVHYSAIFKPSVDVHFSNQVYFMTKDALTRPY